MRPLTKGTLRRALLAAPLACLLGLLLAAPALALESHVLSTSFGEAGSGDGQLSLGDESGLAVNAETHDLYVADTNNHRIVELSSAGAFIRAFGADVGGPGVNVCSSGCKAGTAGTGPGQLEAPAYVAIDNSAGPSRGDVYVGDPRDNTVTKFTAAGAVVEAWGEGGQLSGSAAAATGTLASGSKTISSLESTSGAFFIGEPISAPGIPAETTIAALGSGSLEISNAATVSGPVSLSARAPFAPPNAGSFPHLGGVAVDPEGHLWVLGGLSQCSKGIVGPPYGELFELAPSAESLRAWPSTGICGAGRGVGADAAGNLYVYREAGNTIHQFTPAGLDTGAVNQGFGFPLPSHVSAFALDPSGGDLYIWTQGGNFTNPEEPFFESIVKHYPPPCDAGGECSPADDFGMEELLVSQGGLAVDPASHTVYVAEAADSRIAVFTGPVAVPEVTTEAPSEVIAGKATMNGHLDPAGGPEVASCAFQYISDAAFEEAAGRIASGKAASYYTDLSSGGSVGCAEGSSFNGPASVHATLLGLLPGSRYHYRLVVTNAAGRRRVGPSKSFTVPSHAFAASFAGSGASALANPSGVAVDERSHDVWVTDPAHYRVEEFTASGEFILMIGKGVDATSGANLCTAASGDSCQAGAAATTAGAFKTPTWVAVDNSQGPSAGDLYVADTGDALITKLDSGGHLISSWGDATNPPDGQLNGSSDQNGNGPFSHPSGSVVFAGIAVDPAGNLWIAGRSQSGFSSIPSFFEFDQSGRWLTSFPLPEGVNSELPAGLAVDSAGRLYAASETAPFRFSPSAGVEASFPGRPVFAATGLALDSSESLYVDSGSLVYHYLPSACLSPGASLSCLPGDSFGSPQLTEARGVAVDSGTGDVFVANSGGHDVAVFHSLGPAAATGPAEKEGQTEATLSGHVDPLGRGDVVECRFQYVSEAAFQQSGFDDLSSGGESTCDQPTPISAPTDVSATLTGLATNAAYRYRLLAADAEGLAVGGARSFQTVAVLHLETEAAGEVESEAATLHGSYRGDGQPTHDWFEYGTTTAYGHRSAAGESNAAGPQQAAVPVQGLLPGTTYHFRFVATNSFGESRGEDRIFTTARSPSILGSSVSGLSAESADLLARIDPHEYATAYRFEYGPTTAYGHSAPVPDGEIAAELGKPHTVRAHVEGLEGVTYHYRVVAENRWGKSTSEDGSFEFFPPSCPNAAVRQQTGSNHLPDCRAYEIVSPGEANGTLLFPRGPPAPAATNPSRFAYVGAYSALPGATETIGAAGDLYVASRTDSGWVSHYIGLPGSQASCMGGVPTDPASHGGGPTSIQLRVLADPALSRLLDFNDGPGLICRITPNGFGDVNRPIVPASNAPYLWSAEGSLLAHLPSDLGSLPGAEAALSCPFFSLTSSNDVPQCTGEVSASPDLRKLFFSSNSLSFSAQGEAAGLTEPPGSAYEDDLQSGRVGLISTLPNGQPIPQDPAYALVPGEEEGPGGPQEYLRFPAVSADGSHVLISTAAAPTPGCVNHESHPCERFTDLPLHLYMRVGGADGLTREISVSELSHENVPVLFLGMTEDGSRVLFTSKQQLTAEDPNHGGAALYMWSEQGEEEGHPLTLVSKANPGSPAGAGDTADCSASWTEGCGVLPFSDRSYAAQFGLRGGNGLSDSGFAAKSGDVYFFSPEQLDGDRGVPGQENLYLYRGGELHFVASFQPRSFCENDLIGNRTCTEGPIARMQVGADGAHMAFVSGERLTAYENEGHLEMYSYTPETGTIACDSCNPSGRRAGANVHASQDGLFMTEDGRTFFSTAEALSPADTNQAEDVYEFSDGRPRLITPGTGVASVTGRNLASLEEVPGLVGVSADGTDVYFSTRDSLIAEDRNGAFLKFYDARSGGGFPQPTPAAPCAAAEECRGAGSAAPPPLPRVSAPQGGNAKPHRRPHRRRRAHRRRHHRGARRRAR